MTVAFTASLHTHGAGNDSEGRSTKCPEVVKTTEIGVDELNCLASAISLLFGAEILQAMA